MRPAAFPRRIAGTLLAAACLLPVCGFAAVFQKLDASDSIELSNIDAEDASQEMLLSDPAAAAPSARAAALPAPANLSSADAAGAEASGAGATFAERPRNTELLAAMRSEAAPAAAAQPAQPAQPAQQQYRSLMLQQASFNGGANGNLSSTRKYLKVDRQSYIDALNN